MVVNTTVQRRARPLTLTPRVGIPALTVATPARLVLDTSGHSPDRGARLSPGEHAHAAVSDFR